MKLAARYFSTFRQAIKFVALVSAFFGGFATQAQAIPLDVGAWGGSGCCSFGTRGYWFTAPTDFTITGLSVPTRGQGSGATLEVLRLNAIPPVFSSTTNNFTQLGYWTGLTSVATNIGINAGDVVGVLGWADGITPYNTISGDYATTLAGFNISLQRFGFQDLGMAHDVWSEVGPIGVIGMEYTTRQVPEPGILALMGLGLAGLSVTRRKTRV